MEREPEEAYVAAQLAQTRAYIELSLRPGTEKTTPEAIKARLEKAEAYARWRWRGYQEGEIFSL